MSAKIEYHTRLPKRECWGDEVLVIYDGLLYEIDPEFRKWVQKFPFRYSVTSGEKLKDIKKFPEHILKISKIAGRFSPHRMQILAVGGGTVGDFAGFIASVYKRGVELHHIPSTWLAAIDSAHGGKTGLNVARAKNQIGSFYPAKKIYICRHLLNLQGDDRAFEACSELIKVALLQGGKFWLQLSKEKKMSGALLWKYLPDAIAAKYRIVKKDPYEKSGYRHLLNFGHSMGHVFESLFELPHGIAVMCGLEFSLLWSFHRSEISKKDYEKLNQAPIWQALVEMRKVSGWKNLNYSALLFDRDSQYLSYLRQDKKKTKNASLRFIFLRKPGSPVIREVSLHEVLDEIRYQRGVLG